MSVYNNVRELPAALDSLASQTFPDYEVVAVNDGSTDGSGELLDRWAMKDARVRVIHQQNSGLGPALRRGCAEARGTFLARQDADDVSAPTRLERQVEYLERNPDIVLCGTWTWFVSPVRGAVSASEVPDDHDSLIAYLEAGDNPFVHGSVMMRGSRYREEGVGYRLRRYCEEYDLWLRLASHGRLGMVETPEYLYRLSPGGMSFGNMQSRIALRDLCLKLHAERKTHGREVTDWRSAEMRLLAVPSNHGASVPREAAAAYADGLQRLDAGDWRGYIESMRAARKGKGRLGNFAFVHVYLGMAWPATRWLYRRRVGGTSRRYLRPLRPETSLPDYARGMI